MPYKPKYDSPKETYGPSDPKKRQNYKNSIDEDDPITSHLKTPKIDYSLQKVLEKKVVSQRLVPSEGDVIKPLKLISADVIGGIFDRVIFLGRRIEELRVNIQLRHSIHGDILVEIEKDIDDRMQFLLAITDPNEKRNLKLDISVLRKERRNESVQFWRDLVELNTELKKLEEEFEIETKIASIFQDKTEAA